MPIVLLLVLALATACGSDPDDEVPASQELQPTRAEETWTNHDVGAIRLGVPSAWEPTGVSVPGPDATQRSFQTPKNKFGTRGGAQVVVLDKRKKPAADLVSNIESSARATLGATDVDSEQIAWPGAEDAWLVSYTAQVPSGGRTAPHPARVLVLDQPGTGQAQVTVSALETDPASKLLDRVLESVVVTDSGTSNDS